MVSGTPAFFLARIIVLLIVFGNLMHGHTSQIEDFDSESSSAPVIYQAKYRQDEPTVFHAEYRKDLPSQMNSEDNFEEIQQTPVLVQTQSKSKLQDGEGGGGGGGGAQKAGPAGLTQKEARKVIQEETEPLKKQIDDQTKKIDKSIKEMGESMEKKLNESMQNLTRTVDKMAKHLDSRMTVIEDKVEENVRQSNEMALLIFQSQLEEKINQLNDIEQEIAKIKRELPPLDATCENYFSCSECSADSQCGWCSMEQQCVRGDNIGPLYVSCNFYDYHYCRGKTCGRYVDCQSCISDPDCGWCNDNTRFVEGCMEEGPNFTGCPRLGWFHSENDNNICKRPVVNKPDDPGHHTQNKKQKRDWDQNGNSDESDPPYDERTSDFLKKGSQDRQWQDSWDKQKDDIQKGRDQENSRNPTERQKLWDRRLRFLEQKADKLKIDIKDLQDKIKMLEDQMNQFADGNASEQSQRPSIDNLVDGESLQCDQDDQQCQMEEEEKRLQQQAEEAEKGSPPKMMMGHMKHKLTQHARLHHNQIHKQQNMRSTSTHQQHSKKKVEKHQKQETQNEEGNQNDASSQDQDDSSNADQNQPNENENLQQEQVYQGQDNQQMYIIQSDDSSSEENDEGKNQDSHKKNKKHVQKSSHHSHHHKNNQKHNSQKEHKKSNHQYNEQFSQDSNEE